VSPILVEAHVAACGVLLGIEVSAGWVDKPPPA
jgi:hypothetical protein